MHGHTVIESNVWGEGGGGGSGFAWWLAAHFSFVLFPLVSCGSLKPIYLTQWLSGFPGAPESVLPQILLPHV